LYRRREAEQVEEAEGSEEERGKPERRLTWYCQKVRIIVLKLYHHHLDLKLLY
jgi:hypothetical protein